MMKKTFITKLLLNKILKKYKTPFYIYNEKAIKENARNLYKAFSWNKGYKEYFAVKANPNPYIINILKNEGCGCDCSSLTELILSKACNVNNHNIMFTSNDTPAEEFVYADKINAIINLDDFTHIEFLEKSIKNIPKIICCRYNPGNIFNIYNKIMSNPVDAKYGMTHDQILEAIKILKNKGVKTFGLHSFISSNSLSNKYFPLLSKLLFELCVEIKEKLGVKISFINLSGGAGIPYLPTEKPLDIKKISEGIKQNYKNILEKNNIKNVKLFTEFGRYMLAPYGMLITKAIHKKHIYKEYIGVDACAVNLIRPAMYNAYHHITVIGKENNRKTRTYDIVGALCENNDKFAIDRKLPQIDIGDYLCIHDVGAHSFSMGYNYNGRLKCNELLLKEDGKIIEIRRKETPYDYFSTLNNSIYYKNIVKTLNTFK